MGKFKKGDRVRLVCDNDGYGDTGDTGVIVRPDTGEEDALVRFDREINGDHEWYAPWSHLERVPVAEATGTVKDGDIVRCIEDYEGQFTAGKEYVVRRVYLEGRVARISVVADDSGRKDNGWLACKFVPVQRTLTVREGHYYLTRDGRKVGPARPSGDTDYPWRVGDLNYTDSGSWLGGDYEDDYDLVAEAEEPANDNGSTAGFTVPLCAYEDEPGWYVTELGRAYADGYVAGLRASLTQAA